MRREGNGYDHTLFTADYSDQKDCGEMFMKKDGELSACIEDYLRPEKISCEAKENFLKVGHSCNTFATITRSRLLLWCKESQKNDVAFVMYNDTFTLDAPELYYLLNAVSAEASVSLDVSCCFPDTMCMMVTFCF